jgi:rhomboid protease GluP
MCPNCRAFISTSDKVCPYCDVKTGPRAVDRRASDSGEGFIGGARFTTVLLLLINAGMYIATVVMSIQMGSEGIGDVNPIALRLLGAKTGIDIIVRDEWWRLITAGFLHGGIFHILMNSWIIFDVGAMVEEMYGTARYIAFYILSTIGGFLASTFWTPILSVGASAGLFGLIGAMIALGVRSRTPMGSAIRAHYTQWVLYMFLIGLLPFFNVDNAAHLGGLATGFALAYAAGTPRLIEDWREKLWRGAAAASIIMTAVAFGLMLLSVLRAV